MGWNGSGSARYSKHKKSSKEETKRLAFVKGKVFLLSMPILVLGVISFLLFSKYDVNWDTPRENSINPTKQTKRSKPKSQPYKKQISAKNINTVEIPKPRDKKEPKLLTNVITNVPGRRVPRPVRVIKDDDNKQIVQPIFTAMSDNHLEQLVNYQPGEAFLSIVSPAEVARDFMSHCADKIEIYPDDSPEVAERKRVYAQVREDIKKEILAGGDLEEMIIDARRTLDKISNMRNEYMNYLREEEENGANDDDLDDLATAASTLLKEHGANPILSPRQQLKLWEKQINQTLNGN